MLTYLIVCPMVFLAGLIDAIAGGGGLITLPVYMIAGLPAHNAIATNKLSSSMGATVSFYRYGKLGYVPWKLAPGCIILSMIGSSIGSNLALAIDATILKYIMLVLLPVTAVFVLKGKLSDEYREPFSSKKTFIIASFVAFFVGMYDGFYGPGTGMIGLFVLSVAAHMTLKNANGLTKAINFASNISALTVFLINGKAIIALGLVAGIFSMAGSFLGTKLFASKGAKAVKPVFVVVLVIFFIKIIYEFLT